MTTVEIQMFAKPASKSTAIGIKRALKSTVLVAGLLTAGIATAEAAEMYVIQLSYKNRWDRAFDVHFAPPGGFGQSQCKQSLQKAIDEYGPDLNAAFKRNYGTDIPPGQTFNLKTSG